MPSDNSQKICREFVVRGRVQGVFFRYSARRQAQKLGIYGFARNEPDGSVFVHAEGGQSGIEKFQQWLRQGPPLARVEDIEVRKCIFQNFNSFEI